MMIRSIAAAVTLAAAIVSPLRAEPQWVEFAVAEPRAGRLQGLFERPAGAGPFPAIVMLHGCSGAFTGRDRLTALYRWWMDFALARGFAVLLPDSLGSRGLGSICAVAEDERTITPHVERRGDALGAAAWLAARADIRADTILLMGWSHGAMTAMAVLDASLAGTARPYREALLFYPGCGRYRRAGFSPVSPTAILIGEADDWTRAGPCRAAVAAGAGARLEIYPGAYHSFDHPGMPVRTRTVGGGRVVHQGTDAAAREKAIREVDAFLARYRR
jgi:dienelactone hydrolase